MGWNEFLQESQSSDHAVQIYDDVSELAESVAAYLSAGFAQGEPVVAISTADHWSIFAHELSRRGWDSDELQKQERLILADAEATLATFMTISGPSPRRFEQVVGGLIDEVERRHRGKRVRAFGEMVDLLSLRGLHKAAIQVEGLWNGLARSRDFSLLCGYRLDVFDPVAQVAILPGVCDSHSHIRPASDPARLARAVDRALEEVLGSQEAERVYLSIGDQVREKRVPLPQLALMWVSEHMPTLAGRVLASSRAHYDEPSALPSHSA
jgi:hypothetical protein